MTRSAVVDAEISPARGCKFRCNRSERQLNKARSTLKLSRIEDCRKEVRMGMLMCAFVITIVCARAHVNVKLACAFVYACVCSCALHWRAG